MSDSSVYLLVHICEAVFAKAMQAHFSADHISSAIISQDSARPGWILIWWVSWTLFIGDTMLAHATDRRIDP